MNIKVKLILFLTVFGILLYTSFATLTFFQYEKNEGKKVSIEMIIKDNFIAKELEIFTKFLNPIFTGKEFLKFEKQIQLKTLKKLQIPGILILVVMLHMVFLRNKNQWKGIEHGSAEWANSKDRLLYKLDKLTEYQYKSQIEKTLKEKFWIKLRITLYKNNFMDYYFKKLNKRISKFNKSNKKNKNEIFENLPRYEELSYYKNIILSETEFLPVDDRAIFRNLNILVVGGSGAGKSRYFVKPNILAASMSMVLTDPKGELYQDTHEKLEKVGYKTYRLDLNNLNESTKYNPFKYIRRPSDIQILVETLIKNTNEAGSKGDFWEKSEKALFMALAHYHYEKYKEKIREAAKKHLIEKNEKVTNENIEKIIEEVIKPLNTIKLPTLVDVLMSATNMREGEEGKQDDSEIVSELKKLDVSHPAKVFFDTYNLGEDKVKSSIKISLAVRLAFIGDQSLQNLVSDDEFNLDNVSEKKAIYVIMSDSNSAFNSLAGLFFSQLFQVLYFNADKRKDKRLPIPYQFYLDEFANIGQINSFSEILATCRGRRIGIVPIIQAIAQLEKLYEKNASTIIGNCDTLLYLGGNDMETAEKISKIIGNLTVDTERQAQSQSFGASRSTSKNDNVNAVSRALITPDELKRMKDEECLLMIRGFKPFKSKKLDVDKYYKKLEVEARVISKIVSLKEHLSYYEEDATIIKENTEEKSKEEIKTQEKTIENSVKEPINLNETKKDEVNQSINEEEIQNKQDIVIDKIEMEQVENIEEKSEEKTENEQDGTIKNPKESSEKIQNNLNDIKEEVNKNVSKIEKEKIEENIYEEIGEDEDNEYDFDLEGPIIKNENDLNDFGI